MTSTINGYTIVEEISVGAFCNSYRVQKSGKDYFMKEYKDPTTKSPDYSAFVKNQRTMMPLLASLGDMTETILEDFEVKTIGRYYQIKEFIPGATNLRKWMEINGDYDQRLDAAVQFCQILKAVHGKNIVHQDLKPEQVMTRPDPSKKAGIRLILTDFDWSVPNGRIVRPVATPGYANIDGSNLSFKSDIFTLGIIICELLTGCNPYILDEEGEERIFEPTAWYHWVKNREYISPNQLDDTLPAEINNIIVKCLEPDPNNRPSLDEIIEALNGGPRKKVKLVSTSGDVMFLIPGTTYGRKHFKELFIHTTDTEGNLVYKYLDPTFAIIDLVQTSGQLFVSYPAYGSAKNKLKLNGTELTDKPTPINDGDSLSIYSTNKGADVAVFNVQVV